MIDKLPLDMWGILQRFGLVEEAQFVDFCNDISFYLSAISYPHYSPSSSFLSKGSSEVNPIKSNQYLHMLSVYYLLIPSIC